MSFVYIEWDDFEPELRKKLETIEVIKRPITADSTHSKSFTEHHWNHLYHSVTGERARSDLKDRLQTVTNVAKDFKLFNGSDKTVLLTQFEKAFGIDISNNYSTDDKDQKTLADEVKEAVKDEGSSRNTLMFKLKDKVKDTARNNKTTERTTQILHQIANCIIEKQKVACGKKSWKPLKQLSDDERNALIIFEYASDSGTEPEAGPGTEPDQETDGKAKVEATVKAKAPDKRPTRETVWQTLQFFAEAPKAREERESGNVEDKAERKKATDARFDREGRAKAKRFLVKMQAGEVVPYTKLDEDRDLDEKDKEQLVTLSKQVGISATPESAWNRVRSQHSSAADTKVEDDTCSKTRLRRETMALSNLSECKSPALTAYCLDCDAVLCKAFLCDCSHRITIQAIRSHLTQASTTGIAVLDKKLEQDGLEKLPWLSQRAARQLWNDRNQLDVSLNSVRVVCHEVMCG